MEKWNPFRALSGIEQGLKVRKEYGEKKRLRQGRATGYFAAIAGREPTYRFYLQDSREAINAIESLADAMAMAAQYNRGRLDPDELTRLRRLSPGDAVNQFPHISAEDLAHLYLLVGRIQALARQSVRPDPITAVVDSQTAYYQQFPRNDRRHLGPGERWRMGDPLRPYVTEAFTRQRR